MFRAEVASALLFLVEVFAGLTLFGGILVTGYAATLPEWDAPTLILATGLSAFGLIVLAAVQVGKAVVHIATTNDQILDALIGDPDGEAEQSPADD